MNQGKLEVVKQEMARVNVDILGISEPTWTGMGEFNSDDHYIYYCGQESLRRNGVAIMVKKTEYLLEGLMLKLKLQYFGHLMQTAGSLEKSTDAMDMNLGKLQEMVRDSVACCSSLGRKELDTTG